MLRCAVKTAGGLEFYTIWVKIFYQNRENRGSQRGRVVPKFTGYFTARALPVCPEGLSSGGAVGVCGCNLKQCGCVWSSQGARRRCGGVALNSRGQGWQRSQETSQGHHGGSQLSWLALCLQEGSSSLRKPGRPGTEVRGWKRTGGCFNQ